MITFNRERIQPILVKKGGIIQKACKRSVERVIIRSLRVKDYLLDKAATMAWINAIIIQAPKMAVTIPIIILAIIAITSFLCHSICSYRPLKINYTKHKLPPSSYLWENQVHFEVYYG
jgi:hypothetical protein